MKKLLLGMIFCTICLSLISCSAESKENKIEIKSIVFYTTGFSSDKMVWEATKTKTGIHMQSYTTSIADFNNMNKNVRIDFEGSQELYESINSLIDKYKVVEWNGFDEDNPEVQDGTFFSLEIVLENDETVTAQGYMVFPEHYNEFVSEFTHLFKAST